jgi:transmembrane sensor
MPSSDKHVLPEVSLDWFRQSGKAELVKRDIFAKLMAKRRRKARNSRAAAAAAVAIGILCWAIPTVTETSKLTTQPSIQRSVVLSDGSTVALSARTVLTTDFRYGRRVATLEEGEALFGVKSDPGHPFVVHTPNGTVLVMGTRFNVRVGAHGFPEVTLFDGKVSIEEPGRDPVKIVPGHQALVSEEGVAVKSLTAAELDNVQAWREGRLALDGLTLAEAAERISQYCGATVLVSPAVAAIPLAGNIRLDDLPGFLAFASKGAPVVVVPRPDGSYELTAR